MNSPSIERLYAKLDKHLLLTEAYTEINGLSFVIKACRLKPVDFVFKTRSTKLMLHRWWFDEFGNSFKIIKNKRIKFIFNDLKLNRNKIVCTDLYNGLDITHIIKMSKIISIYSGLDEDLSQPCCLLAFLGIDNRLRSYLYLYGEWAQVSPLLIGLQELKNIAKYRDIKFFKFEENKKIPLPCANGKSWISCLPPSDLFLSSLDKHCELIRKLFIKE